MKHKEFDEAANEYIAVTLTEISNELAGAFIQFGIGRADLAKKKLVALQNNIDAVRLNIVKTLPEKKGYGFDDFDLF